VVRQHRRGHRSARCRVYESLPGRPLHKQKIIEFLPNERVVWHINEAFLNFTQEPGEWVGTDVTFEITPKGGETEMRFTHRGLVPELECFEACSITWGFYVTGV
jgi:hypothetical protein